MLVLPMLFALSTAAVTDVNRTATEVTFRDSQGAHRVRFDLSPITEKDDAKSRTLIVTHEVQPKPKAAWTKVWQAKDFQLDCQFDLTLEVDVAHTTVTDLDDDGIAEVTFWYTLACISDVSPLDMKLLMYEGSTKYALRGQALLKMANLGGTFKADPSFEKAPAAFLAHAKSQWAEANK